MGWKSRWSATPGLSREQYLEVLEEVANLLQLDPDRPSYLGVHGLTSFRLGQDQAAVESLRRSLERAPSRTALSALAMVLQRLGRHDEARAALKRVPTVEQPLRAGAFHRELRLALEEEARRFIAVGTGVDLGGSNR